MPRDWYQARLKVESEGRCRVCARSNVKLDAAHLIPRSRCRPGVGDHPENIVPLCGFPDGSCHRAFDEGSLDIVPFLTFAEQAYAVSLVGIEEARLRLTNERKAAA